MRRTVSPQFLHEISAPYCCEKRQTLPDVMPVKFSLTPKDP